MSAKVHRQYLLDILDLLIGYPEVRIERRRRLWRLGIAAVQGVSRAAGRCGRPRGNEGLAWQNVAVCATGARVIATEVLRSATSIRER